MQNGNPIKWHKLLGTISLLGLTCFTCFLAGRSDGKHAFSTYISSQQTLSCFNGNNDFFLFQSQELLRVLFSFKISELNCLP